MTVTVSALSASVIDSEPSLRTASPAVTVNTVEPAEPVMVAEAVEDVYKRREQISGLKMVYEPEYLRFFQARFEPAG